MRFLTFLAWLLKFRIPKLKKGDFPNDTLKEVVLLVIRNRVITK